MFDKSSPGIILTCLLAFLILVGSAVADAFPDDSYGRIGDTDRSGKIDIDDVIYLIAYIFTSGPPPVPKCTGDVNDSGGEDIDDVMFLIQYIFLSGPQPLALGSVIPKPVSCSCSDSNYELLPGDTIWVMSDSASAVGVAEYLASKLRPATGFPLQTAQTSVMPYSGILLTTSSDLSSLGDEGYKLTVTSDIVLLEAYRPEGLFRGIQTIRQLLPNQIEDSVVHEGPWVVPGGYILDYPSFGWRGFLLDVSRHIFSVETVKEYIDLLALYKMNVFHWHLTDDQGWRAEIDSFPLLNEIGSYRGPDNYGGYYTKEEMADVVQYASQRYISVVPEIEMPGHATAAIASYPSLMCHPPEENLTVPETEGIYNTIFCGGKDSTLYFLEGVLDEIVDVFPSRVIHIGGDEAPKDRWDVCPYCQSRISTLGLSSEHALQEWFINQIAWYLYDTHGRAISGWSEGGACQDSMPPGTVGQWWGPGDDIAALAANGHNVVNTSFSNLYLGNFYCTLSRMYNYNIMAATAPEYADNVLGTETAMFTEFVETDDELADEVFPRLIAVAENAWTRNGEKSYSEFYVRLLRQIGRLGYLGIDYGGMEE